MLYYGLEQHSLDSYFQFKELGSAPSTPTSNEVRLYAKDDGSGVSTLCYKNDAGTEICFPTSGSFVTGTGTDNQMAIWNGTSAIDAFNATAGSVFFAGAGGILAQDNSNFFWDDANNRLGIGTASPATALNVQGTITTTARGIRTEQFSADAVSPNINFAKSRSASIGGQTAVLVDDIIGNLGFMASDGSSFGSAQANLLCFAGENWDGTHKGTYLALRTTPLASTTVAERFRIGPSGQWGIGGATFGTAGQYFRSGGASAAPTWATIDHNTELANVASGDVHTQYALLAGRSGGQTLKGDTASGGNLTLMSTAHATKGKILLGTGAYDEANNYFGVGTASPSHRLEATDSNATGNPTTQITLTDTGASGIPIVLSAFYIDASSTNRLSAQCLRFNYTKNAGATSVPSAFDCGIDINAAFNESMNSIFDGIVLEAPTVASGKTLTTYVALSIPALAGGAGTITNKYAFELPADATDPTGGGGAATGRIPCLIGGALRYIPYY